MGGVEVVELPPIYAPPQLDDGCSYVDAVEASTRHRPPPSPADAPGRVGRVNVNTRRNPASSVRGHVQWARSQARVPITGQQMDNDMRAVITFLASLQGDAVSLSVSALLVMIWRKRCCKSIRDLMLTRAPSSKEVSLPAL